MNTEIKRPNKRTVARRQALTGEIADIIQIEVRRQLDFLRSRDNTLQDRLSTIEKQGVPEGVLEEIYKAMSQIRYAQRKQNDAIEGMLKFFNVSKEFFSEQQSKEEQ